MRQGEPRHLVELALVVVVATAALLPGIASYTLVDPWEGHYGEVGRMMRQSHDYVHLQWPGTNFDSAPNEGFRSKPVLAPWLFAAGLAVTGVAADGGYSGEMVHSARTMIALRLPIVACAIAGLAMLWWMLARLVGRRVAWLALLVVGSSPMFCLVARQAIPDMPLVATVMGAIALMILALEDGDRPCSPRARRAVLGLAGGFVAVQAVYYAYYFAVSPQLAVSGVVVPPALWLPALMAGLLAALSHRVWRYARVPLVPIARAVVYPIVRLRRRGGWPETRAIADHLLAMAPITTMRQVYWLGCYWLLGVGVLAKGPPGLAIAVGVAAVLVVLQSRWRALYDGAFELKRGALLVAATCVPWHIAMFLKDGFGFINDYLFFHIIGRATAGVDSSPGTFAMYTTQLGLGMWLWAAVLPAAVVAVLLRNRTESRAGRVRFAVAIWAVVSFAMFGLVQTKFHHYILPAIPPLGVLVAFWLDDVLARRERLHVLHAAIGVAIALLICRDLMFEPERWVEMFTFRYDRPWPSGEPWQVDPSDGFLALGAVAALAVAITATRWRRIGVGALAAAGVAICLWCLHVYMPIAGTHWGMGTAMRAYYDQRTIYGQKLVYFGTGELYDDWNAATDRWTFETHVPLALQVGQPMTLAIEVRGVRDERTTEHAFALVGAVAAIGDHSVEIALTPGERARLAPVLAGAASGPRGRPPIRLVDADRLIAWHLYWRGENFWSTEEIWGPLPELKATFLKSSETDFQAYVGDPARAPPGRRCFVATEAWRIPGLRAALPAVARDLEIVDTTSNKFTLAVFTVAARARP